jgi:hypothetical protein
VVPFKNRNCSLFSNQSRSCFNHWKAGQFFSVLEWFTSLDPFIYKKFHIYKCKKHYKWRPVWNRFQDCVPLFFKVQGVQILDFECTYIGAVFWVLNQGYPEGSVCKQVEHFVFLTLCNSKSDGMAELAKAFVVQPNNPGSNLSSDRKYFLILFVSHSNPNLPGMLP